MATHQLNLSPVLMSAESRGTMKQKGFLEMGDIMEEAVLEPAPYTYACIGAHTEIQTSITNWSTPQMHARRPQVSAQHMLSAQPIIEWMQIFKE